MGLIYSSADSAQLINALKTNIHSAKDTTSQLTSGSQRIVSAVDGRTLAGAAYTAGKGLFSELIIPTISRVTNAFNQLEQEVQTFQSADNAVKGEGSYLDEDILKRKIEVKRAQKSSALSSISTLNNQIKLATSPEMTAYISKTRRELNSLADSLDEDIRKLQQKLEALHTFSSSTSGLFSNSLNDLTIAMQGVTVLSKTIVMSTGNYLLPQGTDINWFNELQSASDVKYMGKKIEVKYDRDGNIIGVFVDDSYDEELSKMYNEKNMEAFKAFGSGFVDQLANNNGKDLLNDAFGERKVGRKYSGLEAYYKGQRLGDFISLLQGGAEFIGGTLWLIGGNIVSIGATPATGGASAAAVPAVNAGGIALTAHGSAVWMNAVGNVSNGGGQSPRQDYSVDNMNEFFESDFGSELKNNSSKTKKRVDGQNVYKVDKKTGNLKKGDQVYLDGLHKDHLEVFDKNGNLRTVLNLDGTINLEKYYKAMGRKLK